LHIVVVAAAASVVQAEKIAEAAAVGCNEQVNKSMTCTRD